MKEHNHDHKTHYKNIKISNLPHSEVEIEGEIDADEVEKYRIQAVKSLANQVAIPGFRKGHIPESVLVGKLGELAIMEEAAEMALGHEYQHIIIDHKINVISRPQITLTKIARGNPLGFKIRVSVFPEFKLPDYKKIAKNEMAAKDESVVSEKEMSDVIDEVRKSYANATANTNATEDKEAKTPELAPLTDEFVKKLGDFKDVADFKAKLKENMEKEKQSRNAEKKRIKMGEAMVEETKIELPEIVVENELSKMDAQFRGDIEKMGIKFEDYLKHIKKTEEDIKKDWRKDAEKRATLQIILNRIAMDEKLLAEEAEIETEVKHLMEHHKDADPERARNYIETVLTNEKVFRFLESQK